MMNNQFQWIISDHQSNGQLGQFASFRGFSAPLVATPSMVAPTIPGSQLASVSVFRTVANRNVLISQGLTDMDRVRQAQMVPGLTVRQPNCTFTAGGASQCAINV